MKNTASICEILEAFRHPVTGVGFTIQTVSLPSNTFVSIDAIQWLIYHVEGINDIEKAKDKMEVCIHLNMKYHSIKKIIF